MSHEQHYRALENMYLAAPINAFFKPGITISHKSARVEMDVREEMFHSAGALHGSVYFKMLDDAAFFAANSMVSDRFVLTTAFTTYLTRPVTSGRLIATGRAVVGSRTQIIAESVVENEKGREVGRGSGIFVRGHLPLTDALGYADG